MHEWGIVIRVVVLGIILDELLGFCSSVIIVLRFQSCSHSFQCRFARHVSVVQKQRGETVVVEQSGRLALDTSLLIVIGSGWTPIFELAMNSGLA